MNTGKYIFSQLVEFLPQRVFDAIVMKYEGNKYVKHFTCWNQLLVMMFGQLSNRDSLRDLVTTLAAHGSKAYHLGFGKNVTRSNLAKVNERREPKIFEEFAYRMIDIARKKRINKDFEIDGQVYAFDSTTIDLCLRVFWWAKFRHCSVLNKLTLLNPLKIMEKGKKKYNLYTDSERMSYIREYLSSPESKYQFCKRIGVCCKVLNYWLVKYQIEDKVMKSCEKTTESSVVSAAMAELQKELSLLRAENRKLQSALADESLRHEACEELINLAESTYHIKVRKNSDAK